MNAKYSKTSLSNPAYFTFNQNNTNSIEALLIFILDNEVLEYIEKQNYSAIIFDYQFIDKYNLINCLPANIKYIEFDNEISFDKLINNYPPELEYLILPSTYNQSLDYLPQSLKYFELWWNGQNSLANLPVNLEYLDIQVLENGNNNANTNHYDTINYLPDNVKHLVLSSNNCEVIINKLPKYLEILNTKRVFFTMDLHFEQFIDMTRLREIYFSYIFNNSIDNIIWTDTIKKISFGEYFNQPIENLPRYLEILEVGIDFNLEEHIILANIQFPNTLKTFSYMDGFPKQTETIKLLNEIRKLYPTIQFIHKLTFF